ncbi:MAG: zinc ribbon domain-containing protein [Bacteroidetes bacterium]|nr:zinc ribbon domain-containing protein [Bacteroidota bacterium]
MALRECPSCALESDPAETVCPFCGYEFPEPSKGMSTAAWLFVVLLLAWPVSQLIRLLFW